MSDKEQTYAFFYLLLFVTDFIIQIIAKLETQEMDPLFYLVTEGAGAASRQGKYGPKKIIYNSTR